MRRFIGRVTQVLGGICFILAFFGLFLIPGMIEIEYPGLWKYVGIIAALLVVAIIGSNVKE